jgi:hypothetical protein
MSDITESEYKEWEEDVKFLVNILRESFESSEASYYLDELNESLYIELEGLSDYSEEEISEIAGPILEELDLDFEDIILLPL